MVKNNEIFRHGLWIMYKNRRESARRHSDFYIAPHKNKQNACIFFARLI